MMSKEKVNLVRSAALISIIGNLILAVLKIVVGISSRSKALVADGIDSSSDVFISIVSLLIVNVIAKPADEEHPWGHRRAETITTAFLSFVLFFTGAQLIINTFTGLFAPNGTAVATTAAFVVAIASMVGKSLIALSQHLLGKRANSQMIVANSKNMVGDILISSCVVVGLGISRFTDSHIADSVIAILIGLWIIKTAIGIFLEVNVELMDGNTGLEPYRVIIEAVNAVEGACSPHRARMRRVAGFWDIDFDIHVDPRCSIKEAHDIACEVEVEVKKRMENVLDVMIHIEPEGDIGDSESFGLTEEAMREL